MADFLSIAEPPAQPECWRPVPGERCVLAWVHHFAFNKDIGKVVIFKRLSPDGRTAYCSPDTVHKHKRRDGTVILSPSTTETLYDPDQLAPAGAAQKG